MHDTHMRVQVSRKHLERMMRQSLETRFLSTSRILERELISLETLK
jgi:hypothetical protein